MPIGKNAIKRVSNSGYSNVQTSAPDMENSVATTPEAPKAEAPKVEAPKVEAPVKTAPKKTAKKTVKKAEPTKQGFVILAIGDDLPYYLL
jgi:hypothetical protein